MASDSPSSARKIVFHLRATGDAPILKQAKFKVMTPFLTAKLAGQYVPVDALGLLMSMLQVVLLPVIAGALLNQYFQSLVKLVSPLMPPIAVATIAILCGNAIAQISSAILMSGRQVALAAALLHASGFYVVTFFQDCSGLTYHPRAPSPLKLACRTLCLVWFLLLGILEIHILQYRVRFQVFVIQYLVAFWPDFGDVLCHCRLKIEMVCNRS